MFRFIMPLLLMLATALPVVGEEVGAKAIFKDPSLNILSLSPKKEEPRKERNPGPPRQPAAPPRVAPRAEPIRAIGIRSWIQQVDGEGRSLGETGVGQVFRSGEKIQLLIESNTEGYLAVVQHGSDGSIGLLFPAQESELGMRSIVSHVKVVLPERGHAFTFDGHAGTERLFVVLVRDRQDLAVLPLRRTMSAGDLQVIRRVAERELGAKNLIIEALADPEDEPGLYTVNLAGGAIVQEIALVHER